MIRESCAHANVNAQMVELRMQGKDHSSLIGSDEGLYLKLAVVRVI